MKGANNKKKVYQLWGVNFYTGEKLRVYAYTCRSTAFRARKTMEEVDSSQYYYTVKSVTPEEHKLDIKQNIPIEKAMQKLKRECHKFIDDNLWMVCNRFVELMNDVKFEKKVKKALKSGLHEYLVELARSAASDFIECISMFIEPSLEPKLYCIGFVMKVKEHKYSNGYGDCMCVLSCVATFGGIRRALKVLELPEIVSRQLKESVTRKIFRT